MGKLRKNLIYQTLYQILAVFLPLITTPIVTHSLKADGLGQYSFTYAIVSYFSLFILLGVSSYGTREIARAKTTDDKTFLSKVFCEIYYLQLILSVIVIFLYIIYLKFFVFEYKTISIIQGIYLFAVMFDVSWFYFGIEQFKITVTRNIYVKLFCAIIIILFIKSPQDIYLYTITLIGSSFLSNFILFLNLKKYINFVKVEKSKILKHLKPNLVLFIPVIASSVYIYMDKIMLGNISGTVQSGYYEAMIKIMNIPIACITAITNVMYPRISSLVKQNKIENIPKYLQITVIGIGCFSVACFFGMASIANIFVPLFFGKEFTPAINIVIAGVVIMFPRGLSEVVKAEYLLPYKQDKKVTFAIIFGAIVNVIGNLFLIQKYGALGVVFSTIISDVVTCIIMFLFAKKEINILKTFSLIIPFVFFGIGMYFVVLHLKNIIILNEILLFLCLSVIGGIIYLFLCLIYFIFLKNILK